MAKKNTRARTEREKKIGRRDRTVLVVLVLIAVGWTAAYLALPSEMSELIYPVIFGGWIGLTLIFGVVKYFYFDSIKPESRSFIMAMRIALPVATLIAVVLSMAVLMLPSGKRLSELSAWAILLAPWLGAATAYYGALIVFEGARITWLPFILVSSFGAWVTYDIIRVLF